MRTQSYGLKTFVTMSTLTWLLIGCGSDRVNIEFKTPPQLYSDDSKTDPDKLNRELEYDLREAEKKRRQKERDAEAAKAKAEAEQKARGSQKVEEGASGNKTTAP
ncbi:MAG: hypothetical protein HW390_3151 [Candidatus Brocadiaceae bacterium]|nr:hypothetical protein [Candidatus Brocadiaceae bacterium]